MISLLNGALDFCVALLQICQPYGLPIYTASTSRQAAWSFFKFALDFASM
jgi:hypothetical protein